MLDNFSKKWSIAGKSEIIDINKSWDVLFQKAQIIIL